MDRSSQAGARPSSSSPSSSHSHSHSVAAPPVTESTATALDPAWSHRAALPRVFVIHDPEPIATPDSAMVSTSTSGNPSRHPPPAWAFDDPPLRAEPRHSQQQVHRMDQPHRHESRNGGQSVHDAGQPQDRSHQAMYRTLRLAEALRRRAAAQGRTSNRPELSFRITGMDAPSSFSMAFDDHTYEDFSTMDDGIDLALPSGLDLDDDRDPEPRYDDDNPLHDWIPDPEPYSETDDDADEALFWPGLLIERPLNPPGRSLLRRSLTRSMLDRVSPCLLEESSGLGSGPTPALDPDSSTSPSSFLKRGMFFSGIQVYVVPLPPPIPAPATPTSRSERLSSHPRPHRQLAASTMDVYESARALAEGVNLTYQNPTVSRSSSLLPPARPSAQPSFAESSPLIQLLRSANRLDDPVNHFSIEEAFGSFPTEFSSGYATATTMTNDGVSDLDLSPFARARLRTEEDVREIRERTARVARARSVATTGTWNLLRLAELGETLSVSERQKYLEHERWEVKVSSDWATWRGKCLYLEQRWLTVSSRLPIQVIIESIDSTMNKITGYMHALNVPFSASRVTTCFTGEILNLAKDGLWSPGHWESKIRTDAESWSKLGPFKGMKTNELIRKADGDRQWLNQVTKGHVLMRWKERDFVNVTPSESHLSIAGFYFIVLDRGTGMLEGLYHDPTSSPFQRLELSPWTQGLGFSTGTFDIA
ncbi:BZ3500_MvSof-1268-A1-R1_Chr1-3g02066 [Microbotryum saponariae]|uniref:BZ3500_MvSof-1268-A1-R1_Chr1-3g02066 protein n=1 Tax=Microbotryum saponariae TaxID=289078 RepID=A0A2X0MM26_9BASI|nr:BZ3500_MvSof-1268-A1-R1_Chr1-3g02066 [Microbotryum saponariae]SCZ95310.1 BZ3501_MvSof-1269-A2-R1_Chr1-3g01668 [Microbotryum saponariae]